MYFSTIPSTSFCFCFMMSAPMFMAMLVTMGSSGNWDPMFNYKCSLFLLFPNDHQLRTDRGCLAWSRSDVVAIARVLPRLLLT